MSGLLARMRSFWRGLRRPGRLEAEMEEEMRFHIEMEAERLARERGVPRGEALRQAAIAFGGVEKRKEEGREARGVAWVAGLSLDLRLSVRMLAKHPGVTLVSAAGMAVGIAFSASVFSVIGTVTNPVVPLDEGERIVAIDNFDAASRTNREETHLHDLAVWREELTAVGELAAFRTLPRNLVGPDGRGEPLRVAEITASGFRIARVPALHGRFLVDDDEREGAAPVVVIGYDLWRDRFGARPDAVGRTLRLGGEPHTVVGVMPQGFAFPVNNRVWTPLRLDPLDYEVGAAPPINVAARLAPDATLEQLRAQVSTIGQRLAAAQPHARAQLRPTVLPYALSFVDDPQLLWAFHLVRVLVGILLVVIAVNVAILVYARTATRAKELAMRLALGATRGRVATQLFAEALALSVLAAGLGLGAAVFVLQRFDAVFRQSGGELIPFWWDARVTPSTVLYAAGLAVIAAGIVGVVPALKVTGKQTRATLREIGGSTGLRMGRGWTALIALQTAVAISLIPVAAAIPLREVLAPRAALPGVPLEEIFAAEVAIERQTPPTAAAAAYDQALAARFVDRRAELVRRLEAEPGVRAVALASSPPGSADFRSIEMEGTDPAARADAAIAKSLEVEPGVFDLFGARFLAGRNFQPGDLTAPTAAVIVNGSFVEAVLGGGEVLGRRFRYPGPADAMGGGGEAGRKWYEIVGVVSDFPDTGMGAKDAASIYHPAGTPGSEAATILLRVQGRRPAAVVGRLREISTAVDPAVRLGEVLSVAEYMRRVEAPERMLMLAMATLPWTVLLLAAAGIHALVSLTVSQRRREIGLRMALGARPAQVLRGIAAGALRQVALGLGIGGAVAAALIPAVTTSGGRAASLVGAIAAILLIVCLVAVLGPARHGLRIQPMHALKGE